MTKKSYLTSANKMEKASAWLRECRKIRRHHTFSLDFRRSALLILDMQDFFLIKESHAYVPSGITIIPTIKQLIKTVVKKGGSIFYTKHITAERRDDPMRLWWRDVISKHDAKSEITSLLDENKGNTIVKHQYSAFHDTNLEKLLRERGCQQIIITGVMTHLCCETTARDAFMKGFEVFFAVDATATYTEELHIGSLRALSHGFAVCLSSEEIGAWERP